MSTEKYYGATYWRSLAQRELSHDEAADQWREFADDVPSEAKSGVDVPVLGLSRRRFVGVAGASAALAGTGCIRKPTEHILPFADRPEDLVPGRPLFYASALALGADVEGVIVESQDGRPTKIEGNPKHSGSQGATSVWAQAAVLDVYDSERTRVPVKGAGDAGQPASWDDAKAALDEVMAAAVQQQGQGLALCVRYLVSPTQRAQLMALKQRLPEAKVFVSDGLVPWNNFAATEAVAGAGARAFFALDKAAVVFAADSDFLHTETDSVKMARQWARTRRVQAPGDFMSRLYVVEPHLTNTGIMADHRRRVKGSQVGQVLLALLAELGNASGFSVPAGVSLSGLPSAALADPELQKFVSALARDLTNPEHRGRSAIIVGSRQPAWVHVLGLLINVGLGNGGYHGGAPGDSAPAGSGSLRWRQDAAVPAAGDLAALAQALKDGAVQTLLCLDTNPVYEATGDLGLASLLGQTNVIHMGLHRDETALISSWHIPISHFLEAWGDVEAIDGTISVQQPLIDPLHDTYSATELLGFLATGRMVDGYSLVQGHWAAASQGRFSDRTWRQWVHDGLVSGVERPAQMPQLSNWSQALATVPASPVAVDGLELNVHIDPKLLDGRLAANGWLQELPHPVTKLTWDNAAYLSKATADRLGVGNGDLVTLTVDGRSITMAAWIAPGQAEDTISVTLGYGRHGLPVAEGAGVDVNPVRSAQQGWIMAASLQSAGGQYALASTQDYGTMKPPSNVGFDFPERPIVLERTMAEFAEDPGFVEKANMMEPSRLHHLWDPPKFAGKQQWGMSIDLNTCVGCNACVIACQSENNIPVVGKDQVSRGREMHWIRIDRYFRGDEDNPTAVVQPMTCQHCEAAPCETVCPVAATTHSPEGLNDMAYNRCIGTRYCGNNCPYKVRRFNYLAFNLNLRPGHFWTNDPNGALLAQMQKNPDVTVRFRGVMEKCTYCVQRINQAKIEAHVAGRDQVEDGRIRTACQQVCPTEAIVFGDIADPASRVSKTKRSPRDYQVLRDLNNHPRTTYLARIRNPNPELT